MRYTTHAGIALLVIGATMLVASSGAFESVEADRGVSVQTVSDEEAYLGLDYDETVYLESAENSVCYPLFGCFLNIYTEIQLLEITDQTPSNELDDFNLTTERTSFPPYLRDGLEVSSTGVNVPRITCPLDDDGNQESHSRTIEISIEASSDRISIEADRDVVIQCVGE